MSEPFYNYVHTTLEKLSDQINNFIENYTPTNISVPGNATFGSDDSDQMTVNAETTFNGDVLANVMTINTLTIIDNTVVGQDDADTLTVNADTTFNAGVEFNDSFNVIGNAVFGTDTTNTLIATGTITAPHFVVPLISENSFDFGNSKLITYVERNNDTDIFEDFPDSVIVIIKNIAITGKSIIYNSENSSNVQSAGTTSTYLKTSTEGFTLINTTNVG